MSLIKKAIKHITLNVLSIPIYIFKYRKFKTIPSVKKGFRDHRAKKVNTNTGYMTLFKRLIDSYTKAKIEQEKVAEAYQVGYKWQGILDERFIDLVTCLRQKDTVKLQSLLENFHRERFSLYLGGGSEDYYAMRWTPFYKYQFVNTWHKYYNIYKGMAGDEPPLSYPVVGNSIGLYHKGEVIPIEAIRYHYYAMEIHSLLRDVNNPVICEIGSGLGGQAYTVLTKHQRQTTYILLDIPEVLVISSYFLMTALSERKFLLFGESPLNSHNLDQHDIILMPNFVLPQLGDQTVDLFFNACGFSEMNSTTVEKYIHQIERICSRYLIHINYDVKFMWQDGQKKVANVPGSEIIPDTRRFKKIYQHPRLFGRLGDKIFLWSHKARHFAFLYERIRNAS